MRLATLAINLGFLFASFAIGVVSGRQESARAVAPPERLPVAGSAPETSSKEGPPREEPAAAKASAQEGAARGRSKQKAPEVLSWSQVAARAQGSTAAVRADQNYGAGVIIDGSGLVLTNLHVVAGARSISVTPFGAPAAAATLLDSDEELDVALLRLPEVIPNAPALHPAALGSARSLGVGDEVLAVGSPRKMYFSVSRGMVSFPNRFLDGVEYIQTDLPINVGNSGGPLVDREGRVIGLVSFILRDSQGISFALPIDRALSRFAKHLKPEAPAGAAAMAAVTVDATPAGAGKGAEAKRQ